VPRFLDLVTEPAPPISEAMRGLLERIGVNRTPIRHVAAVDQAASDLIDQKLLKRRRADRARVRTRGIRARCPQVSTLNPTGDATPVARRRMASSASISPSKAFTSAGVAAWSFLASVVVERGFHGFHVPGASGNDRDWARSGRPPPRPARSISTPSQTQEESHIHVEDCSRTECRRGPIVRKRCCRILRERYVPPRRSRSNRFDALTRAAFRAAIVAGWSYFLMRAIATFGPTSDINNIDFNSDSAIPVLMANDQRPITIFNFYYYCADRWGGWPFLPMQLAERMAGYHWTANSIFAVQASGCSWAPWPLPG
jgi:hypothetical protein